MIQKFKEFISSENLFTSGDKILLAVSGGIDSMVMVDLFHKSGFNFAIAHCNFQLRGLESDGDASLVREIANKKGIQYFEKAFNTKQYAESNKLSIQEAARKLRYEWFDLLMEENNFQYIATAHHTDDSIETAFINLIRGTGISGLRGILPKRDKVIRPLLFASKDKISDYANKENIRFREDSSNSSDKYLRNKVRLQLLPLLREISPSFDETMKSNLNHFREVEQIINEHTGKIISANLQSAGKEYKLDLEDIVNGKYFQIVLFNFLRLFYFNPDVIKQVERSVTEGASGKRFYSSSHVALLDRNCLIISEKKEENAEGFIIESFTEHIDEPIKLSFSIKNNIEIDPASSKAFLDFDKIKFPLKIRKWENGDYFYPIGMKGKKKLSDFFTDRKLSLLEKENTWLMFSNDELVWVINHRIDNRYSVSEKTKKVLLVVSL